MSTNALGFILQKRKRSSKWCDDYAAVLAPLLERVTVPPLVQNDGNILLPDVDDYFRRVETVFVECNYEIHATSDYSTAPAVTSVYSVKSPDVNISVPEGVWYIRYRVRYTDGVNSGPWGSWVEGAEYDENDVATQAALVTPADELLLVKPFPALRTYGLLMVLPPIDSFVLSGGYTTPDEVAMSAYVFYSDTLAAVTPPPLLTEADFVVQLQQSVATPYLFDTPTLENGTPGTYRTVRVFYYATHTKSGVVLGLDVAPQQIDEVTVVPFEYDALSDQITHVFVPPVIDETVLPASTSTVHSTITLPAVSDFTFQAASSNVGFDVEEIRYEISDNIDFAVNTSGALHPTDTTQLAFTPDESYFVRYKVYQENTADLIAVQSEWAAETAPVRVKVQFETPAPSIENKTLRIPPLSEFVVGPGRGAGSYTVEAVLSDDPGFAGTGSVVVTESEQLQDVTSYVGLYIRYVLVYAYDDGSTGATNTSETYTLPVDTVLTLTSITEATATGPDAITLAPLSGFVYSADPGVVIQYEINGTDTGFIGATSTVIAAVPGTTYTIRYRSYLQTTDALFYSDWVAQTPVTTPANTAVVPPENTVASFADMSGPLPTGITLTGSVQGAVTTSGTTISVTADGGDLDFSDIVGSLVQSGTLAVSLWANLASGGTLVNFGTGGSTLFTKFIVQGDGGVSLSYKNGTPQTIASGNFVGFNQWHHYVAVKTGRTSSIYLDGALIGTVTTENGSWAPVCTFGNGIAGAYAIDRLQFFDIEPTAQQVTDLYAQGAPP